MSPGELWFMAHCGRARGVRGGEASGAAPRVRRVRMPILLAFVATDGLRRTVTCPVCDHVHLWVVAEVRGRDGGGSGIWLGSSVE